MIFIWQVLVNGSKVDITGEKTVSDKLVVGSTSGIVLIKK